MIACVCGGTLELWLIVACLGSTGLAAWATDLYNKWRCRRHNCTHKCGKK